MRNRAATILDSFKSETHMRSWRCDECHHHLNAKMNPVECPECGGEMGGAPRGSRQA